MISFVDFGGKLFVVLFVSRLWLAELCVGIFAILSYYGF
jgi:hypothetical protein